MNNKNEQVKEIIKKLEDGIRNFKDSEVYLEYLTFLTKFHGYSSRNSMLIQNQLPNATYVKGFKSWGELNRKVKKGEKSLKILAPVMYSKEDEETGEKEEHLFFKIVSVFDISQTEVMKGKEDLAPVIVAGLKGNTDMLKVFENVTKMLTGITVEYKMQGMAVKGYFSPMENRIVIRKDLSKVQKAKTIIHELSHALLHKDLNYSEARGQAETEAESIAFIVCKYFGIDTDDYSFPYINGWANDDIKVLKKSLDTIQKTAVKIIEEIEKIK